MDWQQFYETVQRQQEWLNAGQPKQQPRETEFTDDDLKRAFPTDFQAA